MCVCVSLNNTWIMVRVWPVPRWVAECTQPVCLSTVTSVCVDGGSVVNGTNGRRHAEPVFQPSPDERQASREKHEYFFFFWRETVVLWCSGETVSWMAKVCVWSIWDIWDKHMAVRLLHSQLHNQQKAQWWLDFIPGRGCRLVIFSQCPNPN